MIVPEDPFYRHVFIRIEKSLQLITFIQEYLFKRHLKLEFEIRGHIPLTVFLNPFII